MLRKKAQLNAELDRSVALFSRSQMSMPGGVNSPVRAYRMVGGAPRFFVKARGPLMWDVDGVEYVDLLASWGPAIMGHAHPDVVAAVQEAAANGLSFGTASPAETELAELIRERVVFGSQHPVEKVRLVSTGTEATMTAIRLARGYTGRDLLIKFAGHYHGHADSLLAEAGSGLATLALPGSAGVTAATAAQTLVLPYNNPEAVRQAFTEHQGRIAAVIVEAAAANMGVVPPEPGFNRTLAAITQEHGALLVLDEVLTGFRVGRAGWWGLEASGAVPQGADWTPDLVTFGKVIGGGMPLAALGGRAEVMDHLAPLGSVYQAGTLSGNPVAIAAGVATLNLADETAYARIDEAADIVTRELSAALSATGVSHSVQRAGSLFSLTFAESPALDYRDVQKQHWWRYPPFFHAMLQAGINLPPSPFEAWFLTAAHDDEAVSRIVEAFPRAAQAALEASPDGRSS